MAIFFSIKMTFFSCLGFGHNLQKVQLNRSGLVIHYARPFSTTNFLQIHNLLDFAFFAYLARLLKKFLVAYFSRIFAETLLTNIFQNCKKKKSFRAKTISYDSFMFSEYLSNISMLLFIFWSCNS